VAKCPKCEKEVLLESGEWDWLYSCGFGENTSPFSENLFVCSNCSAASLSVRLIDIFIFRVIGLLPFFLFLAGLFASIPWLTLKTVWFFLVLYPLSFIVLWGFVLRRGIVNFWWKEIVLLKAVDEYGGAIKLAFIADYAFLIILSVLGFQGVAVIVNHLFH
jgi:hypothetical protein